MSEDDSFQDESDTDDDSISLLFKNVNNLTLEDDTDIDNNASQQIIRVSNNVRRIEKQRRSINNTH